MAEVIFVEFTREMQPFSVIVREENGGAHYYDVDYLKHEEAFYYHCSGFGGFEGIVHNDMPYYWAADGVKVITYSDDSTLGERLLELPSPYTPDPEQFFGEMVEGEVIYCSVCDDHYDRDSYDPCRHLAYCNECGDFGGRGADEPCEHVRYCPECDADHAQERACSHLTIRGEVSHA